ncbi:hypothetical protein CQS04_00915 [Chryseomicrobium excrementi]|uniref:GGDEF domain-containing protein n=1 Tax=Chryseomicrobium excrementi TaxID=2041346 RepID=A0A2M9F1Y0_9BACL|nr:GGDEF domain-containing protein [Chryseomicrobium excrementi]PJK17476.1 hypothetical protein CQS04_00915 [Chryseomicrobium excrementi]
MEVGQIAVYVLVYLLPAATLFMLSVLALLSNPSNRDNQVVAAIPFLYSALFFVEFIRHLLPISASPVMVTFIFGNIGLLMLGASLHLYLQISRVYLHKKIWLYPFSLYILPIILIFVNLFSGGNVTNSDFFTQQGLWIVPEYNAKYYGTMAGSIILILVSVWIMNLGIRLESDRGRVNLLLFIRNGSIVTLLSMLILGLVSFGSFLPPHSYILIGLIFSVYLTIAIYKFNLIPSLAERYKTIFSLNPNALVIVNERWELIEFNDAAKKQIKRFGLKGSNLKDMLSQIHIADQFVAFIDELQKSPLHHQTTISFEANAQLIHLRIDGAVMKIDANTHYAIIFRDMTLEIENTKLVNKLAYQDSLTGIANRTYFVSELEKSIVLEQPVGVMLLDLNRFKEINDKFGHFSGDEVLRAIADLLVESFPVPHIAARLGGDEFVVLLRDITRQSQLEENISFIRRKGKNFTLTLGENAVPVEYSVGGAFYQTGDTLDELLMRADEQMYKEKYKDRPHERNSFN